MATIPTPEAGLVIAYAYLWRREHQAGQDDQRSWVVVAEGNEFLWPGYDLRKVPRQVRYDYGFLPPGFFNQILKAFLALHPTGKALTPRD